MKCVVIEDERPAQLVLLKYIERTSYLECLGVYDTAFDVPVDILQQTELLFLDIQLPEINGLDFLENLEKKPTVIVTTAYRDYAIKAFEVDVEDYLLKPFSYARFLKSVMRIKEKQTDKKVLQEKELFVYADKTYHKISKDEIDYIEAERDYIKVVAGKKSMLVQNSMNQWEEKLKNDSFMRVHRSYIINFNKIIAVKGNQIHLQNTIIPIGKTYKTDFIKHISK